MGKNRNQVIVRASVVGIVTNLLLAGFKAFVGMMSHSVAITMDALNNLSDAMSSLITIVGTRLAAKPADREHPLGHGRVEYLSASVIALIILYAGITALVESVTKILHPKTPNYTGVTRLIVAVSFDSPDRMETMEQVRRKILQWMPDLKLRIRMDADLSD